MSYCPRYWTNTQDITYLPASCSLISTGHDPSFGKAQHCKTSGALWQMVTIEGCPDGRKGKRERLVLCVSQREASVWLHSTPTAVLWPRWSMVVLYLHSNVYRSSTVAGRVVFAIDAAGAGLGLPSSTALLCQPWLWHWEWVWRLHC